jgi:hypothetical protein
VAHLSATDAGTRAALNAPKSFAVRTERTRIEIGITRMSNKRYHNKGGVNEPAQMLIDFEALAAKQDDEVLDYFRSMNCPLSPSQVWVGLHHNAPITSIRRAITNLTNEGSLMKTAIRVKGPYNRNETCWELTK